LTPTVAGFLEDFVISADGTASALPFSAISEAGHVTTIDPNGWQTLRPGSLEELPAEPGVFELGNLVRNVLLVGGEPNRSLREVVREALSAPGVAVQARCVRFSVTPDPATAVQARLSDYRAGHAGSLPPEQPRRANLLDANARRPGPTRVASVPRPLPATNGRTTGALSA
jgi:hypothetical protein